VKTSELSERTVSHRKAPHTVSRRLQLILDFDVGVLKSCADVEAIALKYEDRNNRHKSSLIYFQTGPDSLPNEIITYHCAPSMR
jgi:hypothetical protein